MEGGAVSEDTLLNGRYRMGALLGRGGMADVYDGLDERLHRSIAIKVLRPEIAAAPGMRERFEREARSAARLNHPAVVAVYDSGEDRGRAYLVMERLPGDTLRDRFTYGPAPAAWLGGIGIEVLGALGAAHAVGLVHRDVKPGNILLAADGRPKVADFGIAKGISDPGQGDLTAALTSTGLILGTPAYVSPEQLEGQPATTRSDLYALGVVLWEGLAGFKPFRGDTAIDVAMAVRAGAAPDISAVRPDVGPGVAGVIRRAMAVRPEQRYPSAAAMAADLSASLLAPAGAPAPTEVLPLPARLRRRRLGAAVAAAAAVLALAILGLVLADASSSHSPPGGAPATAAHHPAASAPTSTTVPATTTTVDPVAAALEREAAILATSSQPGAAQLAQALDRVAAEPSGPSRVAAANQAAFNVVPLRAAGQITQAQAQQVLLLLQQAGATVIQSTPPTSSAGPGAGTSPGPSDGGGKNKKGS
ncbi:MAG: serine/threonine-protein kinase [Acidimicrobiales bacterium]